MRALSGAEQDLLAVVKAQPGIRLADACRSAGLKHAASVVFRLRQLGLLTPTTPADHPDYGRLFPLDSVEECAGVRQDDSPVFEGRAAGDAD